MSDKGAFEESFEAFLKTADQIRKDNRRLSLRFEEAISASPILRQRPPSPTATEEGDADRGEEADAIGSGPSKQGNP